MSKVRKDELKLVKELFDCTSNSSKEFAVEENIETKIINDSEFLINKRNLNDLPLYLNNSNSPDLDTIKSLNGETKDKLKLDNKLSSKSMKKAKEALNKLTPGKKALLQSIFMSSDITTIDELSDKLKEPKEKIEELKANALRSLIYSKT